jgi:hypothetical protein
MGSFGERPPAGGIHDIERSGKGDALGVYILHSRATINPQSLSQSLGRVSGGSVAEGLKAPDL